MDLISIILAVACLFVGVVIGIVYRKKIAEGKVGVAEERARKIVDDAAKEAEARKKIFAGYQINKDVMAVANDKAMVLHCLPAHREEEITAEVFEAHANEIFDEAENRLHVQKAVMCKLMRD